MEADWIGPEYRMLGITVSLLLCERSMRGEIVWPLKKYVIFQTSGLNDARQLKPCIQLFIEAFWRQKSRTINLLYNTYAWGLGVLTCQFKALHCLHDRHYTTLHYTTLHYTTLHYTTLHCATLRYATLHYTTLHYSTLHYITLHYTIITTLHYNTLQYTTLHYTTLYYNTLHYTTLRYVTLRYTTLH